MTEHSPPPDVTQPRLSAERLAAMRGDFYQCETYTPWRLEDEQAPPQFAEQLESYERRLSGHVFHRAARDG